MLPVRQTVRVMDIITDPTRALRKRKLISDFREKKCRGSYWGINTEIDNYKADDLLTHDNAVTENCRKSGRASTMWVSVPQNSLDIHSREPRLRIVNDLFDQSSPKLCRSKFLRSLILIYRL